MWVGDIDYRLFRCLRNDRYPSLTIFDHILYQPQVTSFWHLGPIACSTLHYVQGVAVTSSTLSMAVIALQRSVFNSNRFQNGQNWSLFKHRFLTVRFPLSVSNRKFHHRLKVGLLISVWTLSLLTSLPVMFIRREDSFILLKETFTFCLEKWPQDSPSVRKIYSTVTFVTVYVIPSAILTYCQLTVGYQIRAYENQRYAQER